MEDIEVTCHDLTRHQTNEIPYQSIPNHANPYHIMSVKLYYTMMHHIPLQSLTWHYILLHTIRIHKYPYVPLHAINIASPTHIYIYMWHNTCKYIYTYIHTHVSWYTVYIRYLYVSISFYIYIYLKQARVNSFLTLVSSQSHIYLPIYLPAYLSTYLSKLSIYFVIHHYRSDWNIIYCNRL
jgi:hypothetical protein